MAINRFIPNIADVASNRKESAWPDALHFDVLKAAYNLNGILEGCAISDGSTGLEVDIAVGCVIIDGVAKTVAAQTVTLAAAHATLPRLDLITINTSGTLVATTGTPLAVPVYDPIPSSQVVVGTVLVAATATALTDDDINNTQINLNRQSMYLTRSTSIVTISDDATEKTLASFTIPGRALGTDGGVIMKFGGQVLANTGSPTLRWTVDLGGVEVIALSVAMPLALSSDVREYVAEIGFVNVASMSSQRWFGKAIIGAPTVSTLEWGLTDVSDFATMATYAESTEDTAVDALLDLRHIWSVSNAAVSINRKWLTVERIPPS